MLYPTFTPLFMSDSIVAAKQPTWFGLIKQAIRGEEMDYTSGSIRRAVIMLAIPMIIEMGMESVFALVDLFFVSKCHYDRRELLK